MCRVSLWHSKNGVWIKSPKCTEGFPPWHNEQWQDPSLQCVPPSDAGNKIGTSSKVWHAVDCNAIYKLQRTLCDLVHCSTAGFPAVVQMEMEQSKDVVVGGVILNASYHTIIRWDTVPGTVEATWGRVILRICLFFTQPQFEVWKNDKTA